MVFDLLLQVTHFSWATFQTYFYIKENPPLRLFSILIFSLSVPNRCLMQKVTNSVETASTLKMSFKITVSRDFWPFFCLKDSTWAPYEQAKTVSRTYSFFAKIFAKKRMSAKSTTTFYVSTTTLTHRTLFYFGKSKKLTKKLPKM